CWAAFGPDPLASGFPLNGANGFPLPSDWEFGRPAIGAGRGPTRVFKPPDGSVKLFPEGAGPSGAITQFRSPFPGEAGARNQVRGDGFFGVDLGLSKRWKMPWSEGHSVQFRWEVFNVTNATKFDSQSIAPELDISGSFGNYGG